MVDCGELLMFVAWSRRRKAMSPVPPAMSSIFQPGEGLLEEEPGFRPRTKWSLLMILAFCLAGASGKVSIEDEYHDVLP